MSVLFVTHGRRSNDEVRRAEWRRCTVRITSHDAVDAVKQVLRNRRGDEHVDLSSTTEIRELRLDSLDLAEILVILEQKIDGELNAGSIFDLVTINDLTQLAAVEG